MSFIDLKYALVVCMFLGAAVLVAVIWLYLTKQKFGNAGAMLTVFAVVLLGMPMWSSVEVSVSNRGVSARFEVESQRWLGRAQQLKSEIYGAYEIPASTERDAMKKKSYFSKKIEELDGMFVEIKRDAMTSRSDDLPNGLSAI